MIITVIVASKTPKCHWSSVEREEEQTQDVLKERYGTYTTRNHDEFGRPPAPRYRCRRGGDRRPRPSGGSARRPRRLRSACLVPCVSRATWQASAHRLRPANRCLVVTASRFSAHAPPLGASRWAPPRAPCPSTTPCLAIYFLDR